MADGPWEDYQPQAQSNGPWTDYAAAAAPTTTDQAPASAAAESQPGGYMNTLKDFLWQNIGVPAGRTATNVVAGVPFMAMDMGVGARNIFGELTGVGGSGYTLPSQDLKAFKDIYFPQPDDTSHRVMEFANSVIGGTVAGAAGVPGLTGPTMGPNIPGRAAMTLGQQQAMDAGQKLGMKMTPGQLTQFRPLQQIDARLASIPATSGPFGSLMRNNQTVLNSAAARSIGENASEVSSPILDRAANRMGDVYDAVRDPNNIVQTRDLATPFKNVGIATPPLAPTSSVLDSIDKQFDGLLPAGGSIRDVKLVQNLENLANSGQINAQQLGQLSSKFGKVAYKAMTSPSGDRDQGQALYAVKNHVDDLLKQTMSPDEAANYATTNEQYRNLMTLIKPGVVNPASGNVSGITLANRLAASDKGGFVYGRNFTSDLYKAARFSKAFPSIAGDSGTATRSEGLTGLALSIPGSVGSWAYLKGAAPIAKAVTSLPSVFNTGLPSSGLQGLSDGIAEYMQQ